MYKNIIMIANGFVIFSASGMLNWLFVTTYPIFSKYISRLKKLGSFQRAQSVRTIWRQIGERKIVCAKSVF